MIVGLREQLRAYIERAEIEATGDYRDPDIDLAAIRERSEALDPASPHKADIWLLLKEVKRLRENS